MKKRPTRNPAEKKQRLRRAAAVTKKAGRKTSRTVYNFYKNRGTVLISKAINWAEKKGRIDKERAEFFREQIKTGKLDDFLAGFKAHVMLSAIPVASFIPFVGSGLRAGYTTGARAIAISKKRRGKITQEKYDRAMELHSRKAIAYAATPYIGFLAYVLSNSIRDPELMRVVADYSLYRYVKAPYFRVKVSIKWAGRPGKKVYVFSVFHGKKLIKKLFRPAPKEP